MGQCRQPVTWQLVCHSAQECAGHDMLLTVHLSHPKHDWFDCRVCWRGPLSDPKGPNGIHQLTCKVQVGSTYHLSIFLPCTVHDDTLHLARCHTIEDASTCWSHTLDDLLSFHSKNSHFGQIKTYQLWLTFHTIWDGFVNLVNIAQVENNENPVWAECLIASLTIDHCEFYCLPISFRLQPFVTNLLARHQTSRWCARARFQ